ncbi:hypothetical protein GPALN_011656 [Globodera pallida]|nr:hypothetical protein GPALN_011656 [Globodera pallida]
MLESLVAWVLNNYVGEYFKLNTDQLSIALLQGQVDLENVPLRTTALSKFDIPVQVKCGVIGSLQLRIPLAHIRSQPWTLRLRDCLALLGPPSATSQFHDVQTVDKWQQQRCERWLDELETGHKRKLLEQLGIESTEDITEQNSWWGASLLSSISNNIQVILENAHIRYECPSYNFGVKIQSLTIQTTNSNWRPGFVQSVEGVNIFKKIDITGFSIYWNPDDRQQQQQSNGVRLVPSYEMLKEELGVPSVDHQFILLPFSLEVRIEQNSSRFPLLRAVSSIPRFKLDIRSQRIELELNKRQIVQIQSLAQDWAQFDRARSHRKWRPIVSVHESPKQWWHFAIGRTLDATRAQRRFFSRAAVLARTRLLNAYARAYRRRLQVCVDVHIDNATRENDETPSLPYPSISHEDIALIKQIEHGLEFTYNILHCLREAVFQQMLLKCGASKPLHSSHDESPFEIVRPETRLVTPPPSKGSAAQGWYGWITNWFAEGSANLNELKNNGQVAAGDEAIYLSMKPPKLTKHKLDPELKAVERRMEAEILQVLNESWDESTVLRRDNLLAEIALNVAKVFFRFSEEDAVVNVKPSAAPLNINRSGSSENPSPATTDVLQQLLTFDLSRLCSRIHLSPKEHRTEVSLSVADFSVQRVQHRQQQQQRTAAETSEVDKKKSVESISPDTDELNSFDCDEFDDESLIYGSQQNNAQSTHLLLAIGRTYDKGKERDANGIRKRHNFRRRRIDGHGHCSSSTAGGEATNVQREEEEDTAILRLFYKRLAPKLEVYHELNVSCAPLSIICDECALSGIFEPFTQKMQQQHLGEKQQHEDNLLESNVSPTADTVTHQMFVSVAVPELIVELRSQKAANGYLLNPKIGQQISSTSNLSESDTDFVRSIASSFARGKAHSLLITFSRRDCQKLSKLDASNKSGAFGGTLQNAKTIMSTKFLVKSDNLRIWLLEEGNKINTTPFLRLNIRDLGITKAFNKVRVDFGVSIDYYRLRPLPGWEPLLEHCHKFVIDLHFTKSNKLSVRLKPGIESTIELTLTQPFIERTLDFVSHWNSICKIVFDSEQSEGLDKLRAFEWQLTDSDGMMSAIDIQLELEHGLGISLVGTVDEDGEHDGQKQEELCYGRLSGVRLDVVKSKATYRISCHINSIQVDNQIFGTDRWHFLFCDPSALMDELVAGLPALAFEMSYTPTEFYDVFECFRLKLSNACILLDEQLMWRLVHFVQCVLSRPRAQGDDQQQEAAAATSAGGREVEGMTAASSFLDKNCFFGTLQLEVGNISLSVLTVDKRELPPSLRQLKESYNNWISLFNVENALVTLTPFCSLRSFCAVGRLLETLGNFYLDELKRQKLNIIFAMDAFGNPTAFGNELKEGFQGLIFEGDLAGFAFGLGYGAANSISKLTSSMAQGVGLLTFDAKHEELRRRMRRAKPEQSGPLTHLYGGIKGLGVGVFGGLTAIVKNTVVATQEDGLISGIARGVTTGAIDTVTKPVQGMLDLAEGTASAVKEIVGAPLVRRAHFPDMRLRTSRVCSSLSGLLASYSAETAEAQQELLRITGTYGLNDGNRLLAVVPFLLYTNREGVRVVQRALISLMQCYIVCQVDGQPSTVTHRILFQHLKTVHLANDEQHRQHSSGASTSAAATQQRFTHIEFVYNPDGRKPKQTFASSTLAFQQQHHHYHHQQRYHHHQQEFTCSDRETAKLFNKQIMRAKALFDRRTTGGKVLQRNAKKLLPIFTI